MRIAILGWGSLIWDPRDLPVAGGWQPAGPILPIEFSRVSRDGRLTLVIDERDGVPAPTQHILSARADVSAVVADLRPREGKLGVLTRDSSDPGEHARRNHPASARVILAWLQSTDYDAVVWTALEPNFPEKLACSFSVDRAVKYYADIRDTNVPAVEYVRKAPVEVDTPVRRAIGGLH